MALSSSQIYVATYNSTSEDKSKLRPLDSPQEPAPSSRWRFGRSTTNLRDPGPHSPSSARRESSPNPNPPKRNLERSTSKMSLFNLFSRPKVEKARGHTEVGLAVPMRPQTPPKAAPITVPPKSSLRHNPPPPAQQTIRARSSQMFRPMSIRPVPPQNEFGSWDPPPLFQAFPQSVKHATVQACVFAPEVLMRTQSQRKQAEALRARMDSVRDLSIISEEGLEAKKLEKTHRRLISNSVLNPSPPELVTKIYILVTSGYVLQYAGDGSFDRRPEKVLKLGKDSAAFACDLIPGKHWVLQISSYAHDDGSIEAVPKNSLLSRLRSQNTVVKKSATSFLLVLDSAEEMDSWMTAVRKEIDNQGGTRAKDESQRVSSSTEDSREKLSSETTSHRYQVQRDSKGPTKIVPVDSPHQSQYDSPRIVTSDWESNRSERTASIAESSSGQSNRTGNPRQSVEVSSAATTPISQHQVQLDQLRGRPRFSFMSTATSVSSPGTRNTSRDSSPIPHSPPPDGISPMADEPLRSAMSLKSFHMNPGNSMSSRRRSMQPLPVTNEHFAPSTTKPSEPQRHSLYGPTSPKMVETEQANNLRPMLLSSGPARRQSEGQVKTPVDAAARPSLHLQIEKGTTFSDPTRVSPLENSSGRPSARKHSIPPRTNAVSPPPSEPLPPTPVSAHRQSIVGHPPMLASHSEPKVALTSDPRASRRISANPRPFLRPFPVRPQQQHKDNPDFIPRRLSSLTPSSTPAPLPLSINPTRSVTAPVATSSPATSTTSPRTSLHSASQASQSLRRPTSVQIRSDQAPFLSSTRPIRAVASTPSFVRGRHSFIQHSPATNSQSTLESGVATSGLREFRAQTQHKTITPKRSTAAIGLPPPMPPPDMPLPPPPAPSNGVSSGPPPNIPLPVPPPNMPLPALPPTGPLPALPSS